MKKIINIGVFAISVLLFTACQKNAPHILEVTKKGNLDKPIAVQLTENIDFPTDKIQFFVNEKELSSEGNTVSIDPKTVGIGKHYVTALVFSSGRTAKIQNTFEIFPKNSPAVYGYKVINEYPHDTKAYTQGLEYHNGFLYESTGHYGKSTLRKVEIKTGKVLQKITLDKKYFGEGITIVDDKIIWLTWKAKKGFIYDLKTFDKIKEFKYGKSTSGWGLTKNDSVLLKSDGTNKIWFLDFENQQELSAIQTYTNKVSVDDLNELELIDGKIYANKYQQNAIIIINPNSGAVEGIVDLKGLKKEMEKTQKLVPKDEVLNGIAYDKINKRLFVTGKNWGKLFEIELFKKQ